MSSFYAELHVHGHVYVVLAFTAHKHQDTNAQGYPTRRVLDGPVGVTMDVVPRDVFFPAWAYAPARRHEAHLLFYEPDGGGVAHTLHLPVAYCVGYDEHFITGSVGRSSFQCHVTLVAPDGWHMIPGASGPYIAPAPREYAYVPAPVEVKVPDVNAFESPLLMREGLEGIEKASAALIAKVASKRNLHIAHTADEIRYLQFIGAEANVGGEAMDHILVKDPPGKAALLEEFLHGTQYKLGMIKGLGDAAFAEWHVKDFMVRHSGILALGKEDVAILETLRDRDYKNWQGIS